MIQNSFQIARANSLIAARDWVSWTDDDVTRAQPQVSQAMHQLHSAATNQRHLVTAKLYSADLTCNDSSGMQLIINNQ